MNSFFFCEYILHKTETTYDNYQLKISLIDLINHKKIMLCMIIFGGRTYLPCHIIKPKRYGIEKVLFFNIMINHWILSMRKYVWWMAEYFIWTMRVNQRFIIYKKKRLLKKTISYFCWMHWIELQRKIFKWIVCLDIIKERGTVLGKYWKSW